MTSSFDLNAFQLADPRKDLIVIARAAENAERYEDMCKVMHVLTEKFGDSGLTVEERNLLSVAFKNVVGSRRAAWRTLNAGFEDSEGHTYPELAAVYKKQVESELKTLCLEVIDLLDKHLIQSSTESPDSNVFYLKMAGDYYRYLAEFINDKNYGEKACENYQKATLAADKLSPTHPINLGLALNYSVCCYEIIKDEKRACEMAKKAFDSAISKLDQLDEASYKDSTLIMQLLRDNLTLWTSSEAREEEQ